MLAASTHAAGLRNGTTLAPNAAQNHAGQAHRTCTRIENPPLDAPSTLAVTIWYKHYSQLTDAHTWPTVAITDCRQGKSQTVSSHHVATVYIKSNVRNDTSMLMSRPVDNSGRCALHKQCGMTQNQANWCEFIPLAAKGYAGSLPGALKRY